MTRIVLLVVCLLTAGWTVNVHADCPGDYEGEDCDVLANEVESSHNVCRGCTFWGNDYVCCYGPNWAATDDTAPSDDDSSDDDDTTTTDDHDGDGWTTWQGDCDDTDTSVHPEAEEVPCDGVDNDCDGYGILSGAVLDDVEYATVPMALALADAEDGDTVYVCPGIHYDQIYLNDEQTLTLTSYSGDREDTILDGGGVQTVIYVDQGNALTLSHLTIQNGLAQPWCDGTCYGGGLMSLAETTNVMDCVFLDNAATESGGGGAAIAASRCDTAVSSVVELVIDGCHFERNVVSGEGGLGGAVHAWPTRGDVSVSVSNSSFVDNTAEHEGGAIYVQAGGHEGTYSADLWIDGCTFEAGEAGYAGGAVSLYSWGDLQIADTCFVDNSSGYQGGALWTSDPKPWTSTASLDDVTFTENTAAESGGAIAMTADGPESAHLSVDTASFEYNSAADSNGGAIELGGDGSYEVAMTDVVFEGNLADSRGGGIYAGPGGDLTWTMAGGSFVENQAMDLGGAFMCFSEDGVAAVDLDGVLIQDNVHTTTDHGVVACSVNTTCTLSDCTVTSNSGGGAWVRESDVGASLVSIDTDWGVYPDDNTPWDVEVWTGETYDSFGANESFTCTSGSGCI